MIKPIDIHCYTLRSRASLNAASSRLEHQGALIRIDGGYGCIHPWPELGDTSIDEQLNRLKNGEASPLIRSAMTCAQADAVARREQRSLFSGLNVPRSHATCLMDEGSIAWAVVAGFDRVKVKMGRHLDQEVAFFQRMSELYPDLRWRLDFNHSQSASTISDVIGRLGDVLLQKIDFLEDASMPGEGHPLINGQRMIPLAVDREVMNAPENCEVMVMKPAVNDIPPLMEVAAKHQKRVVVTSYMDHPLGQCYAAWQAGLAARQYPELMGHCGLITHGLFEPDVFTEALGPAMSEFAPPSGTGLGFDELLEYLPWKRLN